MVNFIPQNPLAGMPIEERLRMMRHYRLGGNVQADVNAYRVEQQRLLKEKIEVYTQQLLENQQEMQQLLDELMADVGGDSPFAEIHFQNKVVKETSDNLKQIAKNLAERIVMAEQELNNDLKKAIIWKKQIIYYTRLVQEDKKRQSSAEVAIENGSTILNCVVAKVQRGGSHG